MKRFAIAAAAAAWLCAVPAHPHCEIPCGIYDDEMRLDMIAEDIRTVEKAMRQIAELTEAKEKNYNQIVRWIVNKEEHATRIQDAVWQYFMAQRIPLPEMKDGEYGKEYVKKLSLLHQLSVYAMKSKQTIDLENVARMRDILASFRAAYMGVYEDGVPAGGAEEGAPHAH